MSFVFASLEKARRLPAGRPTDRFATRFSTAMRAAAEQMRNLVSEAEIIAALESRSATAIVTDSRWRTIDEAVGRKFSDAIGAKIEEAGIEEMGRLVRAPGLLKADRPPRLVPRFDLRNPFSEDYVRRRGAELVEGISSAARQQIRDAVEAGFVEGVPPRTTAIAIRESIGLDARLARALARHVESLAVAGVDEDRARAMAERYSAQLLAHRAQLIARTETIAASNQGILDSWRQAKSQGLLPGGMLKRWIAAIGSKRTCPICEELGVAAPVPVEQEFYSSVLGTGVMRPPAHPACRCSLGLVRPS